MCTGVTIKPGSQFTAPFGQINNLANTRIWCSPTELGLTPCSGIYQQGLRAAGKGITAMSKQIIIVGCHGNIAKSRLYLLAVLSQPGKLKGRYRLVIKQGS
jgi:hypothetical protein